jgi:hypothetical protein
MVPHPALRQHPVMRSHGPDRQAMPPRPDVRTTFVRIVDAERDRSRRVLAGIDPMRSLADRLSALGLDDRAVWSTSGPFAHSLAWRFGGGCHARLDWQLDVALDSSGRTTLTVAVSGRGDGEGARARLLGAWGLVEELAAGHAGRLARMLEDYAEEDTVPAPRLRAVG